MKRRVLTDGRWFDASKAKNWEEGSRWDGHNHVSLATGSQWDHEKLYRTRSGLYVLHSWSQWQGSRESYEEINASSAARWLARNEHDPEGSADVIEAYAKLDLDYKAVSP